MRVFVTGATGVIGRRAVPLLLAEGHEVTALVRDPARDPGLQAMGARLHAFDIFDPAEARRAFAGHDAVVNLATHIPPSVFAMMMPGAWRENDRIRRDASAVMAQAARAEGVGRFVQESFAPVYPDRGDRWIDETVPAAPAKYNRTVMDAEASAARFTGAGGAGVVLRFAGFYGPDDPLVMIAMASLAFRFPPLPGRTEAYFPFVSQADAAAAVVAALTVPAGIYNVSENEPMRRGEFAAMLAGLLGKPKPRTLPPWLPRLMGSIGEMFARSLRLSNRKLKEASGWAPAYATSRESWAAVLREMETAPSAPSR